MGITIEVNLEAHYIETTFHGEIGDHDMLNYIIELYKNPYFHLYRRELLAPSGITSFHVSQSTLNEIFQMSLLFSETHPDIKIALVPQSDGEWRLAEQYIQMTQPSNWKKQIFTRRENAIAWLSK